jgi:hypothetical protein
MAADCKVGAVPEGDDPPPLPEPPLQPKSAKVPNPRITVNIFFITILLTIVFGGIMSYE